MLKHLVVAASLSVFAVSAFAQSQTRRTEATGNKRVMNVSSCQRVMTTDLNGNPRAGFQLPVTYCVEYKSFDAIKHGKGWTASYEQVGEAQLSYKMDTTSESFTSFAKGETDLDDTMITLNLGDQCENMRRQLKQVVNTSACQ